MEIIQVKKEDLKFNDLPHIKFKTTLPLLINQNNEVLLGNSIKNNYLNLVDCIKIQANNYLRYCLYNLEKTLIEENDLTRLYSFEKEIREYINCELLEVNSESLFDYKETGFIDETRYNKPPAYNFEKHNTKKNNKQEEDKNVDLFSCFGEL